MLKRDTKMRCRVISARYLFIIYNLVSGSGAGARNTDVTAPGPVKTEMHTTPHNLTKNISKLVLRNLKGLGSYLKPNTKLYRSCQNDNI